MPRSFGRTHRRGLLQAPERGLGGRGAAVPRGRHELHLVALGARARVAGRVRAGAVRCARVVRRAVRLSAAALLHETQLYCLKLMPGLHYTCTLGPSIL